MSYLYEKKTEHEAQCEDAIRHQQFADAVFHAGKAAEFAYALAKRSEGRIAERYIVDAEGWLDLAEKLRDRASRKSSAKSKGSGRKREPSSQTGEQDAVADDQWLVTEKPDVTFDRISGMEEAKQAIRELIVYPLKAPDKARLLRLPLGGGVLMYGPPGNGKTTLARAAANELDAAFFYATGAEIRSKWHGESEQRLRALIQAARSHPVAILFLDDVDGLLPRRSGKSAVDNRMVVQFLNEVGGFEDSENILLILGATNCPWELDEAVFRTGRFDQKLYIGPPDRAARLGILRTRLEGIPLEPAVNLEAWADKLHTFTGSDIVGIVNAAKRACHAHSVVEDSDPVLTEAHLAGALKSIPSSVTDKLLRKYEQFREKRFAG